MESLYEFQLYSEEALTFSDIFRQAAEFTKYLDWDIDLFFCKANVRANKKCS